MIRYLTSGESHGEALVGIVEGLPAMLPISVEEINRQLARRWLGYGRGGRSKFERDQVHVYGGIRFGKTIGSPVCLMIRNEAFLKDKSQWPEVMSVAGDGTNVDKVTLPRPGHADLVGVQKYGFDDIRPVIERSSARETAIRVACCSCARALLDFVGISIGSRVVNIGKIADTTGLPAVHAAAELSELADSSEVRMISSDASKRCVSAIRKAKEDGDSLGGSYEVVVTGVPPGLGSYVHWDRKLDGRIAGAVLSVQGQKAVEIGNGIAAATIPGSKFHDPILKNHTGYSRASNNAGGIEGGVANGMPIVVRGYMKPIPTLIKPLSTVDISTGEAQPTRYERSDVTSVPAASVVVESVVAFEIARALVERYGGDSAPEVAKRMEAENANS